MQSNGSSVFKIKLDVTNGFYTIRHNNKYVAMHNDLKGKQFVPILGCYYTRTKITLSKNFKDPLMCTFSTTGKTFKE